MNAACMNPIMPTFEYPVHSAYFPFACVTCGVCCILTLLNTTTEVLRRGWFPGELSWRLGRVPVEWSWSPASPFSRYVDFSVWEVLSTSVINIVIRCWLNSIKYSVYQFCHLCASADSWTRINTHYKRTEFRIEIPGVTANPIKITTECCQQTVFPN